jgi:hypothetical protein
MKLNCDPVPLSISVPLSIFLTLLASVLLLIGDGRGRDATGFKLAIAYFAAWPTFLYSLVTNSHQVFFRPATFLLDALGWHVVLTIGQELMALVRKKPV